MNGMNLLQKRRFWPPRFGLRALLLFVLAAAIVFAGFESRRRTKYARNARAEFVRLMDAWKLGVVPSEEIIAASQNLLAAERRQWFSSSFDCAMVDAHILRLTRIRDDMRYAADHFSSASEEDHQAAVQRVDDLTRLIEEAEISNRESPNEPVAD
jgi:hypothetical protein